ncbi:hypothetical protein [Nonomuraea recticatena]|uniref:hypothetical protein n=1 Tax=Nonomuraea recticatena TaxID=46178 RepID=UPI0031F80CBD
MEGVICPRCGVLPPSPFPSGELWVRRRGDEVRILLRVGRQVVERTAVGAVDVAAVLGEALSVLPAAPDEGR